MNVSKLIKNTILGGEFLTHAKSQDSKVLYYHDLFLEDRFPAYTSMATSFKSFQEHIKAIKDKGFVIVDKITEPKRQVMLAFDDGWEGIYSFKDFFVSSKIFPTLSIPVALIGLDGYLSKEQIKELFSVGFNFISHSWTHQPVTIYNNNENALKRELLDSKKYLEDLLSNKIDAFCFPRGLYSRATYEKCMEYGYEEVFTCEAGNYSSEVFPRPKEGTLLRDAHY